MVRLARDKGTTRSLSPLAGAGFTITGRWLRRCTTGTAELTQVPRYVTATGSLQADKSVMVSTRMMGWVREIHVEEGQSVEKGDRLLTIDDTDLQAKKQQAEAGKAAS